MADAPEGPAVAPMSLRLSIPVARAFRDICISMAAKFARTAGFSGDEVARFEQGVARAADQVSAAAGDGANLDIELEHESASGVEFRIRRAGGEAEVVRLAPRP
jgi:hypothetical protein